MTISGGVPVSSKIVQPSGNRKSNNSKNSEKSPLEQQQQNSGFLTTTMMGINGNSRPAKSEYSDYTDTGPVSTQGGRSASRTISMVSDTNTVISRQLSYQSVSFSPF